MTAIAVGLVGRDLVTPRALPAEVILSVAAGERFAETALHLQHRGVIAYASPLRLWARWTGLDRQVQSGDFRFIGPLSPVDALRILCSAPNALLRVTIPEGTTVRGVAAFLAQAGLAAAAAFPRVAYDARVLRSLNLPASGPEGYLFPDTYDWARQSTPETILHAMVQRFHEVNGPLAARANPRGLSPQQIVTLASLIEKETGVASERRLVSAVFHNRLRLGMRLQSDPTTVYGRDETAVPRQADLLADTPYNTYLHDGLPPGPICNPGRAAVEAAVNPADVPYLYFVARSDGGHEFSVSLDDHNRAVARYRRSKRDRG